MGILSMMMVLAMTLGPRQVQVQRSGDNPIYKITINVVEREATAINYQHRAGSTTIDFKGTPLLPEARGEAKVESKQGYIEIEVEFDDLQPATRFGPEYLTYVLWAISPEGRAVNLGEILLNGTKSKLDVSSDLQTFGMVVTAEPYFSVTQPSDVVVMQNALRPETRGQVELIQAKYELLQRGQYSTNVPPGELKPIALDPKTPLEVYEARNAVRIARWMGADRDAADSFAKAQQSLNKAEDYLVRKETKPSVMSARESVQTAEDARLIALKRQDEARLEKERQAAADREAAAKAEADRAARARAEAENQQRLAEDQRRRAEEQQRLEAGRRAQAEAATADAKAAAERARAEAELAQQQATNERQQAANERQQAQAELDRARQAADAAERDKQLLRSQLTEQFNKILETRDTARGLIVNMSDVLFDTAKYTLKPGAREKLAKISGIVLAHPGLMLSVEGHTDSVGSDDYNQKLSEQRANSVREYLLGQGVASTAVTARGFGESQPVASNDTAAGRQQNRRVEMVVSGDIIGTPLSPTSSLKNN
jgi:outer membrane protein OmpA-like peptidoglycan-associated protein